MNWLNPRVAQALPAAGGESEHPLRCFVIHTAGQDTAEALRTAGELARGLNAEITLLAALEVPLPLPLTEPPVSIAFTEDRLRDIVRGGDTPASVDLLLCRDRREAIRQALPPLALVVFAGRRRWFARATNKLAASLARDGHKVIFVGDCQNL